VYAMAACVIETNTRVDRGPWRISCMYIRKACHLPVPPIGIDLGSVRDMQELCNDAQRRPTARRRRSGGARTWTWSGMTND